MERRKQIVENNKHIRLLKPRKFIFFLQSEIELGKKRHWELKCHGTRRGGEETGD